MTDKLRHYVDVFVVFAKIKDSDDMWMLVSVESIKLRHHKLFINLVFTELILEYYFNGAQRLRWLVYALINRAKRAFTEDFFKLVNFFDY